MTPQQFIAKWQRANLSERSACQQHFLDLCELLGQPKPAEADPDGAWYTFERGVRKTDGGNGWADVWMRNHFGWEYKGKHKDLKAAYRQLQLYREDLENPPLLVVCDLDRFEVHTNFTGTPKTVHAFDLAGLANPANLDVLRKLFTEPDALKPGTTTARITQDAADEFCILADGMRDRGIPAPEAAHFLMKLMFCMFAEDIRLLPEDLFKRIVRNAKGEPARLAGRLRALFEAMAHGGDFGTEEILHFNGGLFADAEVIDLTPAEIEKLARVTEFDWSQVEPSVFGTLFERTLDPSKRSQIGAHYTSRDDILTLLEPVMMTPLRREWQTLREKCDALLPKIREAAKAAAKEGGRRTTKESKARKDFDRLLTDFNHRLSEVTVLDPACGSGNFLFVALQLLLDLEKEVIAYAGTHNVGLFPAIRPTQLSGLEINPYAQQLAQVVIWIGFLQWMHHNGFAPPRNPVLEPIDTIERMDAILDMSDPEMPTEPAWPDADFIIGNPPFLGTKMLRGGLGDEYVNALFRIYGDRIPGFSDLCCYWFEKARECMVKKPALRVGLLATQAIRNGAARTVLERIQQAGNIFFGVSDQEWFLDGAAVHVSMIGFTADRTELPILDGKSVSRINPNLTAGTDATRAHRLAESTGIGFVGDVKGGPFDVPFSTAVEMLRSPSVSGRPTSDVLRLYANGLDVTRRSRNVWVIDFGSEMSIDSASTYGAPFDHVAAKVKPMREAGRPSRSEWWLHMRPCPSMRVAVEPLARFIATPTLTKHRLFVWMTGVTLPDHQLCVFALSDDCSFGVLHSRIHELWARSQGTQLREKESGFRYTPTTCFESFPFPKTTSEQAAAIGNAAKELDTLRNNWLNPPEWTCEEILEFPGSTDGPWTQFVHNPDARGIGTVRYPRIVPKDADCGKKLAKRTLTNLYNERPTWLDLAHKKLDAAVFAAYGWNSAMSDDELLAALLALNLERAGTV